MNFPNTSIVHDHTAQHMVVHNFLMTRNFAGQMKKRGRVIEKFISNKQSFCYSVSLQKHFQTT